MKQIWMIITAEGCREWILSQMDASFGFYVWEGRESEEKIVLYQKEGIWSFDANTKGFLKKVFGKGSMEFCFGEQKIWEYTGKSGEQIVFLTFGKKQKETEFLYYALGAMEEITIGKSKENRISYDCMGLVSNCHGVCKWENGMWEIYDKSQNGIFVENKRIWERKKIGYGDCIEIFGLKIIFFGRVIGVENRQQVQVAMEPHHWVEQEEKEEESSFLQDGIEVISLSDEKLQEKEKQNYTQQQKVFLGSKEEMQSEFTENPTLFFAIGPLRMMYDSKGKKKCKIKQIDLWKEKQEENISRAYEEEKKRFANQSSVFSWLDSGCWREELWTQTECDGLWVTLGMGKRKSEIAYSIETSIDKREKEELEKLLERYQWQEQVPVGIHLLSCKQLEIVGETVWQVMRGILLQIAASIPYTKLRIVCLAKKENPVAKEIRWLPHIWSMNSDYRYYATEKQNVKSLFLELEKEKEKRHTLVLVEERTWLDEIQWQYECEKDGYSFLFLVDNIKNCSKQCGQRLMVWRNVITFFREGKIEQKVVPVYMEKEKWRAGLRKLNPLRLEKRKQTVSGEVELFHIYTKEKRKKEAVFARWKNNRTKDGISAWVGLDETGTPICLDIQEKQQGPHGLIAGTTGAGKSIFLQTFVLSLAMEYAPGQLEFVLIDYKGGDMATPLCTLPHVVGTLTNLHPQLLKRGVSAIQSEIEKRQQLLKEHHFFHMDFYNAQMEQTGGKVVPHLCIVVDEFAELTKDAPYFLETLLKVSRVGRSLGMHLILATQKPAGTVTEHIWANSRFRLCFMVQSKQDSLELLHQDVAANIAVSGEGFLQIGTSDSLAKIRVAHAGAYAEEERSVTRILENGTLVKKVNQMEKQSTQRAQVVSLLTECAREIGEEKKSKLWMPLLSECISYTQRRQWEKQGIWLGWCDIPKKQKQVPLLMEERHFGNVAVLGEVGRGKTMCIKVMIWELVHQFKEKKQWIFVCDFEGNFEKKKHIVPWIGNIVRSGTTFEKFMYFLFEEYEKRRESTEKQHPAMWVFIDDMEMMRKETKDWYMDELSLLIREGKKYGIYFVLVAQSYGIYGIPSTWKQNIVQQLVFLEDREEKSRCYPQMELPDCTGNCPGRGITVVDEMLVEFQCVYIEEKMYEEWLQSGFSEKKETPFVLLPEKMDYDTFLKIEQQSKKRDHFSIGCQEMNGSVLWLPMRTLEHFFIVGKRKDNCKSVLCACLMQLKQKKQSCLLVGNEQSQVAKFAKKQGIQVIANREQKTILPEEDTWVFVEDFLNWVMENGDWMFEMIQKNKKITWVPVCQADEFRTLRKYAAFRYMMEKPQGVYIGSGIREQSFFDAGHISRLWEKYMEQQDLGLLFFYKKMELVHFPNVDN